MSQLYELRKGGMGHCDDVIREIYLIGLENKSPEELKKVYNELVNNHSNHLKVDEAYLNNIRRNLFDNEASLKEKNRSLENLAEAFRQVHFSVNLSELEKLEKRLGLNLDLHF